MTRLGLLVLALAGCGSPGGDDDADCCDASSSTDACIACELDAGADRDGATSPDANDAGDAAGDRPQNAACDLFLEQCVTGLTCRYTGIAGTPFSCQPVGAAGPGQTCISVTDCALNLGCFNVGGGMRKCLMICDTANPARCQAAETCYAQGGLPPEYPATTGVCGP